jgi:hypothetical protein
MKIRPEIIFLLLTVVPVTGRAQTEEGGSVANDSVVAPTGISQGGAESSEPTLDFGGHIRFNYSWQDYNEELKDRYGDFGFESFRIDVNGEYDVLDIAVQYRFYQDFEAIRYGYVGYDISSTLKTQVGIHQVPFGILPAAAHGFWFGATYYMGFEDDYDMGLKFLYSSNPWEAQLAFYKNAEYVDNSRAGRYSFDMVTGGEQANIETNQLNGRIAYLWTPTPEVTWRFGGSAEVGQIYNETTRGMGSRHVVAVHSDLFVGNWNLQIQGIDYRFSPENPPGVDRTTVQLGAFAFPFLVAAEGRVLTVNGAREIHLGWRIIDAMRCYTDWSKVFPRNSTGRSSTQVVTGCVLMKEGMFTYIDVITGKNMWFAGGSGIGLNAPDSNEWKSRLNINLGFYF